MSGPIEGSAGVAHHQRHRRRSKCVVPSRGGGRKGGRGVTPSGLEEQPHVSIGGSAGVPLRGWRRRQRRCRVPLSIRRKEAPMRHALVALAALAAAPAPGRAEPIYFVVAERPGLASHHDSFILPLSDPADVTHARRLVAEGPAAGRAVVLADIAAGADGVNRDRLAPGAPAWSWHVAHFRGFAEFSPELYDGWPGFVEADVAGWMANTGGAIGFWGYTVVAEVRAAPEPAALAL